MLNLKNLELGFDFDQEHWYSIKICALVSAEMKLSVWLPIGLLGTVWGLYKNLCILPYLCVVLFFSLKLCS